MRFQCVRCRADLNVPDDLVGQYVICWNCSAGNVVPDPPEMPFTGRAADYGADKLACCWCGYSLEGLSENRCPECGRRFDPCYVARMRSSTPKGTASSAGVNPTLAWAMIILSPFVLWSLLDLLRNLF
jgi:hypothetical protein